MRRPTAALVHSVAVSVNPSLFANARCELMRDLQPVAMAAVTPNLIYVHPEVKATTLPELLALARDGKLSYASSGNGTTTHPNQARPALNGHLLTVAIGSFLASRLIEVAAEASAN